MEATCPFGDLPPEIVGLIAEGSREACRLLWYHFRAPFRPRQVRDMFVDHDETSDDGKTTSMFGRLQSIDDAPAQIKNYKLRGYCLLVKWYDRGDIHRVNGPAIIDCRVGKIQWYQRGQLHRVDGPASMHSTNNVFEWLQNGKYYREEDDLATILTPQYSGIYRNGGIRDVRHSIADTADKIKLYREEIDTIIVWARSQYVDHR